jgi:hypothetical protein
LSDAVAKCEKKKVFDQKLAKAAKQKPDCTGVWSGDDGTTRGTRKPATPALHADATKVQLPRPLCRLCWRMVFLRKHWYFFGAVIFVALAGALTVYWNDLIVLRKLMIMSYLAVLFHQFEECAWPGGFTAIYKLVFVPVGNRPERSPTNRRSFSVGNVYVAWAY